MFCEDFLRRADEDPEFSLYVIFSDESLFTRKGVLNSRNMHVWDDENPRVTRLRSSQIRWKLIVWAGIMGTKILGPVILPEKLSSGSYVQFLTENLPDFLEDVPFLDRNKIIFQQDGAGSHNARIVMDFLNQQFPARWMSRYGRYAGHQDLRTSTHWIFSCGDTARKKFIDNFPRTWKN